MKSMENLSTINPINTPINTSTNNNNDLNNQTKDISTADIQTGT
jgi:hypothetical protein